MRSRNRMLMRPQQHFDIPVLVNVNEKSKDATRSGDVWTAVERRCCGEGDGLGLGEWCSYRLRVGGFKLSGSRHSRAGPVPDA